MTNAQSKHKATFHAPEPMERKIGGTVYIVRSHFKKSGNTGLLDKLWRLIQNNE